MFRKKYFTILLFLMTAIVAFAQQSNPLYTSDVSEQRTWVDNTYDKMTLEERIGQLFITKICKDTTACSNGCRVGASNALR